VLKGEKTTRRGFLTTAALAAAATALPVNAFAAAAPSARGAKAAPAAQYDFLLPRVKFACEEGAIDTWNVSPGGDQNLLREAAPTLNLKVKLLPGVTSYDPYYGDEEDFDAVVYLSNAEELKKYPLVFMTGEGRFDLDRNERRALWEYVTSGGMMLIDDCVLDGGDAFFKSAHAILAELFGRSAVVVIPHGHEVFTNVFDLSASGLPRIGGIYHEAEGIFVKGRLGVFLSSTDLHCGWTDIEGRWYTERVNGDTPYAASIKMGTNIIKYAISHASARRDRDMDFFLHKR
jgi:hypothetical protein